MSNWYNAKKFVPKCDRCGDYSKMGISSRCPSCDSDILMTFERLERNEFIDVYYYQDGRDFYMFLNPEDVKSDAPGALWRTYSSIIKVPDWDIMAAGEAERNFLDAYCKEYMIRPIKLKMFNG